MRARCLFRPAVPEDAAALAAIYRGGRREQFAAELERVGRAGSGSRHYVAEADGEVVALFTVTELPRLNPRGRRRLLLHGMKLLGSARGTGVAEELFGWLQAELAVGSEFELLALTPPGPTPGAFEQYGLLLSHQAFKWGVAEEDGTP